MPTRVFAIAFALSLEAFVASAAQPPHSVVRVGVTVEEPLVMVTNGVYAGFSTEIWEAVARDIGVQTEYVEFPTLAKLLEAVRSGSVDLTANAIGASSERARDMELSLPFLEEGLQVMIDQKRRASLAKLWTGLAESGHLQVFAVGLGVVLLGTVMLTLAERRWNKEFHEDWPDGLAESFYHCLSICMTGKSTHRELPGPFGKVLAALWLVFGVGVVAYITSAVTSVMTVNRLHSIINGPADLPGHRVAFVQDSTAADYVHQQNIDSVAAPDLPSAVRLMLEGEAQAVIGGAPQLQWYDFSHPDLPITEVGPQFRKRYASFGLPFGSALRVKINEALLRIMESGEMGALHVKYFGQAP